MLLCLDGTGGEWSPWLNFRRSTSDNALYRKEFAGSFVSQIYKRTRNHSTFYIEGPAVLGQLSNSIAGQGLNSVLSAHQLARMASTNLSDKLFIVGYSRGAFLALEIAKLLHDGYQGMVIYAIFLFDPVDRLLDLPSFLIRAVPPNVRRVYCALRDPKMHSREIFGSVDVWPREPLMTAVLKNNFMTTHAGMGGMPGTGDRPLGGDEVFVPIVPLPVKPKPAPTTPPFSWQKNPKFAPYSFDQDYEGSKQVGTFMWRALRHEGIQIDDPVVSAPPATAVTPGP